MVRDKYVLCTLLFAILPGIAIAQISTNSPYTRYGYGHLSEQIFGQGKAMGGIAYGLRDYSHINPANPASYTAIDSLAFLFEMGATFQNTNFSNGTTKMNAGNSSFDYVAMQFRLKKGLGVSLGLLPYSNVGYHVSEFVECKDDPGANHNITYSGSGGLHQAFLGVGYKPFGNLSVGANFSYFWGETFRTRAAVFSSSDILSYAEETKVEVKDFKLDIGAQYTHRFNRKNELTAGAVFSPKRELNADTKITRTKRNSKNIETIDTEEVDGKFEIPTGYGIGATYRYDGRLMVGADLTRQKWGDVTYMNEQNKLSNYTKLALGAEYLPSLKPKNIFTATRYRAGAYYANPYYRMTSPDNKTFRAAKEYGVTAGIAVPMPRAATIINLSFQYIRVDGQRSYVLGERYMKINIGLTFNERWFTKRRVN